MKINTFNKTLLAAFMAVSLAACTNSGTPESSAAENKAVSTEASEENKDIIEESITEDSENNKAAEENESVGKSEEKDSQNADKEEEKDSTIDVKKEEAQASNEEQSQENNDIKYEERDGLYFSSLASSKNGERDEEFNSPYLANLKIEGDTLTVDGTIDYLVNPEDFESAEKYENASYNFKLSDDVTLQAVGGLAEPEYFSKEEFVEYYQKVKDSGLALKIEVKDGVVTTVSFAS